MRLFCKGITGALLVVSVAAAADEDYSAVEDQIRALAPQAKSIAISETPIEGLLMVQINGDIVYATADGKYLIQGRVVDMETREDLTEGAKSEVRRELLAAVDSTKQITFAPEKPAYDLMVFTDIDCGYCRKLHAQIAEYNQQGIAIHYMAFPRAGVGSTSYEKAVSVWCAGDSDERRTANRVPGVGELPVLSHLFGSHLNEKQKTEVVLAIHLGFVLVMTNFLFSQSIPLGIYMLACVWLFVATLVGYHRGVGRTPTVRERLVPAGMLLAQAVPLMLVFFILFPRVQGPLWALPQDARAGISGLSDTMTPGNISTLIQSDATAFRVEFDVFSLESALYTDGKVEETVKKLVASGHTYEQDDALWLRTTDFGDDKDRVMRKREGGYTYFVPDVAYHWDKWKRGFERVINEQGADHHSTITRVRAGLQALDVGIPNGWPDYVLHQMVTVLKNGEEVKISKRAGSYVTLRDLIDEVGCDATRYFLAARSPDSIAPSMPRAFTDVCSPQKCTRPRG